MKLSIIIPVYNEKRYFEVLLKKVLDVKIPLKKEIIIVEGNSDDGTKELVKKYEGKLNFKIIYEYNRSGKGAAVRKGIRAATGDIILIQDSDLEYNPKEYNKLLKPILKGKTKFVLGSRNLGLETWAIRKYDHGKWYGYTINVCSEMLYLLFYVLYGVKYTDPQTMFKIFHKDCLKDITLVSNKFDLDWEIVCKLTRKGFIATEIPVSYKGRTNEEGKKINVWRDGPLALWTIIKYRLVFV